MIYNTSKRVVCLKINWSDLMISRRSISIITAIIILVNIVCVDSIFAYTGEYDISDKDVQRLSY